MERICVVALGAVGIAAVARALAPATLREKKPLSCDLCSAWWGTVLFLLATARSRGGLVLLFPAAGLAWIILAAYRRFVNDNSPPPSVLD